MGTNKKEPRVRKVKKTPTFTEFWNTLEKKIKDEKKSDVELGEYVRITFPTVQFPVLDRYW